MVKPPKSEWYWPLGALGYGPEIRDFFPEEAEMIGVITILWNRQEMALRRLFCLLVASKRPSYAEAIWDRQPTHQARRDLLAVAFQTVRMTKRQAATLKFVLEKTKVIADRRNELIHAEYVVHGRTDQLHAKVKSPRSNKPPKHQKVSTNDLQGVIADLGELVMATEFTWGEFYTRKMKRVSADLGRTLSQIRQRLENPQSDSAPQSPRRKPRAARRGPPPPSEV
jgi:hypothetical protein